MNSSPWDCILGITASPPPLSRLTCQLHFPAFPCSWSLHSCQISVCLYPIIFPHQHRNTTITEITILICGVWSESNIKWMPSVLQELAYHETLSIIIIWSLSPWHCDCDHCDQLQGWSALIGVSDPVILTRTGGKPRGPDGDIGLCMTLSHGESRRKVCCGY